MKAFQPAELWVTEVKPMRMELPSGKVIEEGSRKDHFVKRYRWKWLADLHRGFVRDDEGTLWFFKVREVSNV